MSVIETAMFFAPLICKVAVLCAGFGYKSPSKPVFAFSTNKSEKFTLVAANVDARVLPSYNSAPYCAELPPKKSLLPAEVKCDISKRPFTTASFTWLVLVAVPSDDQSVLGKVVSFMKYNLPPALQRL